MKSPSEIAAEAVQEALYARAAFAQLIARSPAKFRAAVENDPRAQTEFMARQIVDHLEGCWELIPGEHALELIEAARVAARHAQAHIRCRVEKDLANALRSVGRFREAGQALRRAESLVPQTLARQVHRGMVEFGRLALCGDIDRFDEARHHARRAVKAFEFTGAEDRAYAVRLYLAWMHHMQGDYLVALAAYLDAARRAQRHRPEEDRAHAYYNVAQCYRGLGDFGMARRYFAKAARLLLKNGRIAAAAKSARCVARMEIRMHGESFAAKMDQAKAMFLKTGLAGEVCRCTIAVMEELLQHGPHANLTAYWRELQGEALELGLLSASGKGSDELGLALRSNVMTQEILDRIWDLFGSGCRSVSPLSATMTVEN